MPAVSLSELIAAARDGSHLVSFPTDTVPALAARPDSAGMIFAAKQRSETKPLILMGASAEDLWPYVQGSAEEFAVWQRVADRYWGGALTLVLPASDRLPRQMNPTDPTSIGIRVPDSAIARHILAQTGPLATTSVNRSGESPLTTIPEINAGFPEVLTLSVEKLVKLRQQLEPEKVGAVASGVPSTVVRWMRNGWEVLRQGSVDLTGG
jgi:L-threonylcarbamoyladenylate synthase